MGKFARRFLGRLVALADKFETDWLLFCGLVDEPGVVISQTLFKDAK